MSFKLQLLSVINSTFQIYNTFEKYFSRLIWFATTELFAENPIYVFLKSSPIPIMKDKLFHATNIEYIFDSEKNTITMDSDDKLKPLTILSAEIFKEDHTGESTELYEITNFLETMRWSGTKEPTPEHLASAWAITKNKYLTFDGSLSMRFVNDSGDVIIKKLEF
jgi:hypothetical protein